VVKAPFVLQWVLVETWQCTNNVLAACSNSSPIIWYYWHWLEPGSGLFTVHTIYLLVCGFFDDFNLKSSTNNDAYFQSFNSPSIFFLSLVPRLECFSLQIWFDFDYSFLPKSNSKITRRPKYDLSSCARPLLVMAQPPPNSPTYEYVKRVRQSLARNWELSRV
jgi:hypothetical protein